MQVRDKKEQEEFQEIKRLNKINKLREISLKKIQHYKACSEVKPKTEEEFIQSLL